MFWRFFPFAFLFAFIILSVLFLVTKYGDYHLYKVGMLSETIGFFGVFYYAAIVAVVLSFISAVTFSIIFDESDEDDNHIFTIAVAGVFSGGIIAMTADATVELLYPLSYYVQAVTNVTSNYFYDWVFTKFLVIHTFFIISLTFLTFPVARLVLWGNRKRVEKKHQKAHQQQQALLQAQKRKQAEQNQVAQQRAKQEQKEATQRKRQQQAETNAREAERQRVALTYNIQTIAQNIDTVTAKNGRLTQEIRTLERIVSVLDIFDDDFLDNYPKVLQYIDEEYQLGRA